MNYTEEKGNGTRKASRTRTLPSTELPRFELLEEAAGRANPRLARGCARSPGTSMASAHAKGCSRGGGELPWWAHQYLQGGLTRRPGNSLFTCFNNLQTRNKGLLLQTVIFQLRELSAVLPLNFGFWLNYCLFRFFSDSYGQTNRVSIHYFTSLEFGKNWKKCSVLFLSFVC